MLLSMRQRQRTLSVRQIEEQLDELTSIIVRRQTPFCSLCGWNSWKDLECGHYYHRVVRPTRWDFNNLATMCRICNRKHNEDREPYRLWLVEKLGHEGIAELSAKARSHTKFSYTELLALLDERKSLAKAA